MATRMFNQNTTASPTENQRKHFPHIQAWLVLWKMPKFSGQDSEEGSNQQKDADESGEAPTDVKPESSFYKPKKGERTELRQSAKES